MRKKYLLITTVILTSWAALADGSRIPERIEGLPHHDQPAWISLEEAVRDGQLREDLFLPGALSGLERYLENSERQRARPSTAAANEETDGSHRPSPPPGTDFSCDLIMGHVESKPVGLRGDLTSLLNTAKAVAVGTVSEVRQGFFVGKPASMLAIEPHQVLYRDPSYTLSTVLVHYGQAAFRIGSKKFCLDIPPLPDRPAPGDRLLIITPYVPRDAARNVLTAPSYGVFLERADGELVVPQRFEDEASARGWSSLEDVTTWVRQELERYVSKALHVDGRLRFAIDAYLLVASDP